MRELRWPLLVFVICLPVIALVFLPGWWRNETTVAAPLPVPTGEREIAWFHTTTNAATWEKFVTGVMRTPLKVDGLHDLRVDDSGAFPDSTTAVPELVLSRDGHTGKLRIRWYKLQNQVGHREWVRALAARTPAPLAVIGGGSTIRALDLARAMEEQAGWAGGDRPPLLVSTATADNDAAEDLANPIRLVDIYKDRTFRFCYSNRAMAEAVVDFVYRPENRLSPTPPPGEPDRVLVVSWHDDQYSLDLQTRFMEAVAKGRRATFDSWGVAFSVGGFVSPNALEQRTAQQVADHLSRVKDERVLLVLPSTTQPARRLLQAVLDTDPTAANRLVVVTGDGIPVNAVLRDGEFAWPVGAVPVPLVLFAHNNPVDWDEPPHTRRPPSGYEFHRRNGGTEEANHFGTMAGILAEECFPAGGAPPTSGGQLIRRLKSRPACFDVNGERTRDSGEHVVVVRPPPKPTLEVWVKEKDRWKQVGKAIELKPGDK